MKGKYCLKKNITLFEKYFALNKILQNNIQVEPFLIFWLFFKPKFFYKRKENTIVETTIDITAIERKQIPCVSQLYKCLS